MLSVKTGTQTWSKAPQQVDHPSDGNRNISARDQEQFFGDQNVGDILNKVADPNYVPPEKQVRKVGDASLDKDAFMKLLLTQMKNQDPTNPMQSHEMAAQLAQFTSLEKLTNINDGISALTKAQAPTQNFEALGLLGKAVAGDSSNLDRTDEQAIHPIEFRLSADSQKAIMKVKDAEGKVVRTVEANNMKAGKNEIVWNGKLDDGQAAPRGSYKIEIEARGSNGQKLFADTKFEGIISGINFTPQGPVLMIGKQSVPLRDVKQIIDPNLQSAAGPSAMGQAVPGQMAVGQPALSMAQVQKTAQNSGGSAMQKVPMSREMVNQLSKQGVKAGI